MAIISTALRTFKEPTKDELTEMFFSIPPRKDALASMSEKARQEEEDVEKMDINAVLSLGTPGEEDSYVSAPMPMQYRVLTCEVDRLVNCTLCTPTCASRRWIARACASRFHYLPSAALSG